MADGECMVEKGDAGERENLECKKRLQLKALTAERGLNVRCQCGDESMMSVCSDMDIKKHLKVVSANNNHCPCAATAPATANQHRETDMTRRQTSRTERAINSKWNGAENTRKMRRTSSFDSCESSDSGVAALSSTDSSQSSATSDITEPGSPPSPVTPPRAGTPLPPSLPLHHHSFHHRHHHHHLHHHLHHHEIFDGRRGHSPPGSLSPPPSSVESSIAHSPPQPLEPLEEPPPFSTEPPATALRLEILHPVEPLTTASCCPLDTAPECVGGPVNDKLDECAQSVPTCQEVSKKVEEPLFPPPPPPPPARALKRKASAAASTAPSSPCRWSNCRSWGPCSGDLMEHLRTYHVEQQSSSESFVCLWEGCKVYNRASCSRSWLERHVLTHGGNKPFKCIVDGCGQRFTSQGGLERHVNGHFNNQHQPAANGNLQRRKDDTPTKMLKKKRLKCFRRRCWTARTEDFFDSGVMECVQHRLVTLNSSTELTMNGTCSAVTFHSNVIARRVESSGKVKVLLHWTPEDVIPDEWVCESQAVARSKQIIRLSKLPEGALGTLQRWTSMGCKRRRSRRK